MDIKEDGFRKSILFFAVMVFLLLAGCAAPKSAVLEEETPLPPAEAAGNAVLRVSVAGAGDSILIETNTPAKYTAFSLSDPARIIIDMPGVTVEKVESHKAVGNDFVDDIFTSVYGEGEEKVGRIEIAVKEGVSYDVRPGEEGILVGFTKSAPGVLPKAEAEVEAK
ncbi:MAG TPA: AMIN domain-containing protein, partial [Thermodesulfobacteriota bacterium]|nr:AMIN domain-containing protein [Thermodesulfobacteriota bacterium]